MSALKSGSVRCPAVLALAALCHSVCIAQSSSNKSQAAVDPSAAVSASSEAVVITASRTEQSLADAMPGVRVITRAQIDQLQATDVAAVLRATTSIDIAQSGPAGSSTSVFVRGANSNQVLVLVNGIPINRADFGIPSWQSLPIDQIERIEIVRGNLSPVWGSQAMGGVVNVITRRAVGNAASLSIGSQGTRAASAATSSGWGQGATAGLISIGLSARHTDGYDARTGIKHNADRDGGTQEAASLNLEQAWAVGHRSRLTWLSSRNLSDYDSGSSTAADRVSTRNQALGLHTEHALMPGLVLGLDGGQTQERFDDPTGYTRSGSNQVDQWQAQLRRRIDGEQVAGELIGALETRQERFTTSNDPLTTRRTDSLRLGWMGRMPLPSAGQRLEMQVHARHDRSSAWGQIDTGMLGLGWVFHPEWRAWVSASNGFAVPSFVSMQYAAPGVVLKPERSRNLDASLQWQGSGDSVRMTVFRQNQRDKIGYSYDPVSDNYYSVNVDRARNEGVEVNGRLVWGPGVLGLDLTHQNPVNEDTGRLLARRARDTAVLSWQQQHGAWEMGAWLRSAGPRFDSDYAESKSPSRNTLDATVAYLLSDSWRLGLRIENLGGSTAPEVSTFTPPPRAVLLTLRGKI